MRYGQSCLTERRTNVLGDQRWARRGERFMDLPQAKVCWWVDEKSRVSMIRASQPEDGSDGTQISSYGGVGAALRDDTSGVNLAGTAVAMLTEH